MNEVKLSGKLCNPIFKTTATGTDIFEGAIVVSRKDKKTNQWLNGFMPIVAFKQQAVDLKAVGSGSIIEITSGKISVDAYKDKNGDHKQKIAVMIFEFAVKEHKAFTAHPKAVDDVKAYDLGRTMNEADDIPF